MQDPNAYEAATRYGTISNLRAQAAMAIAGGDYRNAMGLSIEALRISHDALIVLNPGEPAGQPHFALAGAVLSDLAAAQAAAFEAALPTDVAELEGQVRSMILPVGGRRLPAAPRRCPHGRMSYDGNCMSIPPCPGGAIG